MESLANTLGLVPKQSVIHLPAAQRKTSVSERLNILLAVRHPLWIQGDAMPFRKKPLSFS